MTVVHPDDFPGSAGVACSDANLAPTGTPAPNIRQRPASSARIMIDSLEKAPMKLLFSLCLVIASTTALADTQGRPCETFAPTDEVSEPLTIAEIEREDMSTLSEQLELRSDYPPVPFGFINAKWVAFSSEVPTRRQNRQLQHRQALLEAPGRRSWLCPDPLGLCDRAVPNHAELIAHESSGISCVLTRAVERYLVFGESTRDLSVLREDLWGSQ